MSRRHQSTDSIDDDGPSLSEVQNSKNRYTRLDLNLRRIENGKVQRFIWEPCNKFRQSIKDHSIDGNPTLWSKHSDRRHTHTSAWFQCEKPWSKEIYLNKKYISSSKKRVHTACLEILQRRNDVRMTRSRKRAARTPFDDLLNRRPTEIEFHHWIYRPFD
jgi:hypothetical protein